MPAKLSVTDDLSLDDSLSKPLRILHTADWHLGKRLMEAQRYKEFALFLDWLIETIALNAVDVLIVAGDIFDTMTPSNKAQELYYGFLGRLAQSGCKSAVIVAGNHDSPSFLDAPKNLFRHFNIHVIGTATHPPSDEAVVLKDRTGAALAIVAAIPYLRDKDVRKTDTGDAIEDKEWATLVGIHQHYQAVLQACQTLQEEVFADTGRRLPMIATGHLFAAGAMPSAKDDGMRELYVGTLGQVGAQVFSGFDYVALGHIHREQMVAKQAHIRYSGSPMAFCFDEIGQDKKVLLVEFDDNNAPKITPIIIPVFRTLRRIQGTFDELCAQIVELKQIAHPREVWLDVVLDANVHEPDLTTKIGELIGDSPLLALSIRQAKKFRAQAAHKTERALSELSPKEVFLTLLDQLSHPSSEHAILFDEAHKAQLMDAYETTLFSITHDDKMAT